MHVAGGSHVSGATSESIKKKNYAGCVLPVQSFDFPVVQHQRKEKTKQLRLSSLKEKKMLGVCCLSSLSTLQLCNTSLKEA